MRHIGYPFQRLNALLLFDRGFDELAELPPSHLGRCFEVGGDVSLPWQARTPFRGVPPAHGHWKPARMR